MMRSLFSGVAGLKVHQTRMDVIGNNIANVNTTSYKSQSMVFSDLLYQTTQAASGANAETGRGGINARQIGLGAKTGAISTAITQQGSAQSTNNPWDVMITGESFFVVSNGSQNFFTRDGSFTIDGAGNLVMSSTGYTVMGWKVDPETGDILPDVVTALRVMSEANMTYPPESTTKSFMSGIVDKYDTATSSTAGRVITLSFFDNLGYSYTAKFSIHKMDDPGQYYMKLDDILNEKGDSLVKEYNLSSIDEIASFGSGGTVPSDSIYTLLESAIYNDDGTYSMRYTPENMLMGYSSNQIISASKTTDNPPKITLGDGDSVTPPTTDADGKQTGGTDVTVTGGVDLTKSELLLNYGLLYEDGEYYTAKKDADGNPVKDANGNPTKGDALGNDATKWADALAALKVDKVSNVTVNPDTGTVTMEYEMKFKVQKEAKWDATEKCFVGEKIDALAAYGLADTSDTTYTINFVSPSGQQAQISKKFTYSGNLLVYSTKDGTFSYVGSAGNDSAVLTFNAGAISRDGTAIPLTQFSNIDIDCSLSSNVANGGTSTAALTSGDKTTGMGTGRKVGEMTGVEIAQDGKITAYYDNNQNKLLGQIAVANFANAAGLSKQGDNLYSATANSGEFDGVGDDITAGEGYMTSGVLEMSNVDLSQEFTEMITTQRGFQANSRIITVSDTMLEELVNLKR